MKSKLLNGCATLCVTPARDVSRRSAGQSANQTTKSMILCGVLLLAVISPLRAVTLLTTITNPAPGYYGDYFGWSVAVLSNNLALIGAPYDDLVALDAGAAYLYSPDGTLLTTFTNSTATTNDYFGHSVAAAGSDRVLIGAAFDDTGAGRTGAAYLFNTNGTQLTTFTNPTPVIYDYFGWSVAAVGNDRMLISAYWDDTGATDTGAAYLFSDDGTLLKTFSNPTPGPNDDFGYSVAALGSDRILIGARGDNSGAAYSGSAYLFGTNGALLKTFANPTPVSFDYFGTCVAAVGSDRVLIGAPSDNTGATDAGAAYLFSTNGTLLTTFTNPAPAYLDSFGIAVAAVGSDRVLIGAHRDDTGATDAGIAYLFSTDGTLLTPIINPAPDAYDWFGFSVAAGYDLILIGAYPDSYQAGTAHLYRLQSTAAGPLLSVLWTPPSTVAVFWPSPSPGWYLQQNTDLTATNWLPVTNLPVVNGNEMQVILPLMTDLNFFRLHKP